MNCNEAIDKKFNSHEWKTSKWRDPDYIIDRYSPRTAEVTLPNGKTEKKTFKYAFSADEILMSLDSRQRRSETDPYAVWDYITTTISEHELRTIVVPFLRNK